MRSEYNHCLIEDKINLKSPTLRLTFGHRKYILLKAYVFTEYGLDERGINLPDFQEFNTEDIFSFTIVPFFALVFCHVAHS